MTHNKNVMYEEIDLEELQDIIDAIHDIGIDAKASFKATLQGLKQYDNLHKFDRTELKQTMTRYDIGKEKRIIVTDEIKTVLNKRLSTASDDKDIVTILSAEISDFNLDIIDALKGINANVNTIEGIEEYFKDALKTKNSVMDNTALDLISSGLTDAPKDIVDKLKNDTGFFAVGYMLNKKIKGIYVEESSVAYMTFKIITEVNLPSTLPIGLFTTIYNMYIEDNKSNIKDGIKLYKEAVINSSKLYKVANKTTDDRVLNHLKSIEKAMTSYCNDIIEHVTDVRTYQKKFIYSILDGFDMIQLNEIGGISV